MHSSSVMMCIVKRVVPLFSSVICYVCFRHFGYFCFIVASFILLLHLSVVCMVCMLVYLRAKGVHLILLLSMKHSSGRSHLANNLAI